MSFSPPTSKRSKTEKKLTKEESLKACSKVIQMFMDYGCDFICLGEVSSEDVDVLSSELKLTDSEYTVVNGCNKVGKLIFDTCIFFKKTHQLVANPNSFENLIYSVGGRQTKVAQRYEFRYAPMDDSIVLYLTHWSSKQSTDDSLYESIAQDLRNAVNKDLVKPTILLGDFNVEPHHESLVSKLQSSREKELVNFRKELFYNPCWKFLTSTQIAIENDTPSGTYYLRKAGLLNDWHVIDQILISSHFLGKNWKFKDKLVEIIDTNSLLEDAISDHMAISMLIERVI
ncbi:MULTISPECIES: hypothetical protein [unclassified Acinetobacter]|uniref:endonuclease/exonuclease/phosphatase family protein n=1 Tax=unclassified Acinetobacter TaxID=196816 RepID=UPI00244B7382|nr:MULTISPECIES: hypothetical protein [unclassified Acinetobacter]MDH0030312.1 endonuclease/exonuclease/phosphatase family protein [Acinetobacter sp. GD04021]MDH0885880.1 endonuclease/exonuclease/phosphatase family protein [Acinetobacter sp. GD03873]MDH1082500.1 endonuclease/exonuclease/phosphatase family protein [Acinetobacter sp. GD03983]MDH2189108.1 endonuclease/exonuclease/phosphatase family protein [Acinetobacter sp. GD03645]MDH2202296.1 endonuclease/exonuclease/phosphatase family protein